MTASYKHPALSVGRTIAVKELQKIDVFVTAGLEPSWLESPPPWGRKGSDLAEETVHTRLTRRGVEAAGGEQQLADALHVPLADLQAWLAGRALPPENCFLELLDIVARRR